MKRIQKIFGVFLALSALFSSTACQKAKDSAVQSTGDEIVIGEVGSLTGNDATFGTSTRDGVDLAVQQLNKAGGINGKKVRVVVLDDQGKPEEAATAMTKLITQDKVVAVLGEVASTRSLAMAPIAQANKIPMISPSSTNPEVTLKGNYIFRVCFIDPFQGAVMAKFAANSLKVKKVAILKDVKNDYSIGLSQFFTKTFKSLGGEIIIEQSYSANDIDFKSQLTAIKSKSPDAIYVPGYYTEVGLISRQAKELGLNVPLLGGDGWDSEKLKEIGGNAINGNYFSNHYTSDTSTPEVQKFVGEFKAAYGSIPDGLGALGYDSANVLFDAMKRAKSLSPSDIRDAIAETKNFKAVTGTITLDHNRNPVKSAVVIEIKNGAFVYKETVLPDAT